VDAKLALVDAVSHPVKAHIDRLRAALFDGVIGNTVGAGVVCLYGSGWLWVHKLLERGPDGATILCIVEKGTHLRLSGG
jgi:hypothetical protein